MWCQQCLCQWQSSGRIHTQYISGIKRNYDHHEQGRISDPRWQEITSISIYKSNCFLWEDPYLHIGAPMAPRGTVHLPVLQSIICFLKETRVARWPWVCDDVFVVVAEQCVPPAAGHYGESERQRERREDPLQHESRATGESTPVHTPMEIPPPHYYPSTTRRFHHLEKFLILNRLFWSNSNIDVCSVLWISKSHFSGGNNKVVGKVKRVMFLRWS